MSGPASWERMPYGRGAWLVRFAERPGDAAFERGRAIAHHLERHAPPGVAWVVAFTTVFLEIEPGAVTIDSLLAALETAAAPPPGPIREIPVVYDGEDLSALASTSGLATGEIARLHAAAEYRVYALGFSPGFPYLGDLDPRLHSPRRATPRIRVPAGSVAIGGEHTGIYPFDGPGGWTLIGRTPLAMLDPAKDGAAAFALRAGDRVRFVPVATAPALVFPSPLAPVAPTMTGAAELRALGASVEIRALGAAASLRDAGRPAALRRFGLPPASAMDPAAAARANALAGNSPDAPVIEALLGGLEIVASESADVVIAGAAAPGGERRTLAGGDRIRVPMPRSGLWSYVAIAGGFDVARKFGSVAPGPSGAWGASLGPGLGLRRGEPASRKSSLPSVCDEPTPKGGMTSSARVDAASGPLRVWRGPQWALFDASTRDRFLAADWTVSPASNRTGFRLSGPSLPVPAGTLASEPVRTGTVQVPPDGQPIATMPDGPTVGGYAKIAWIEPDDLARLAQTRPGGTVRFRLAENG